MNLSLTQVYFSIHRISSVRFTMVNMQKSCQLRPSRRSVHSFCRATPAGYTKRPFLLIHNVRNRKKPKAINLITHLTVSDFTEEILAFVVVARPDEEKQLLPTFVWWMYCSRFLIYDILIEPSIPVLLLSRLLCTKVA